MITVATSAKLSVKELAGPVGVSVSFLYKARAAGLPMAWDRDSGCFVATPAGVKRWIKRTKFRVVNGRPIILQKVTKK